MKRYKEFLKENKNLDFRIGDRIICMGGNVVDGYNVSGFVGTIIQIENHGGVILNGNPYHQKTLLIKFENVEGLKKYWWVPSTIAEPESKEDREARLKKKEELKLKHKDIDPFEEEDWGD